MQLTEEGMAVTKIIATLLRRFYGRKVVKMFCSFLFFCTLIEKNLSSIGTGIRGSG